ncbi:MAG: hypothetical protein WDZ68_00640 [Candidatus Paceibacterota bacterium]
MFISHLVRATLLTTAIVTFFISSTFIFTYTALAQTPAPIIETEMEENEWYPEVIGAFEWELPEGVTAVAAAISTSSDHEPMFVYEPPIAELEIGEDDIVEGVQYVSVQFRDENGWGDIAYYRLQIDRTPPTDLYLDIVENDQGDSILVFNSIDALSGIVGYVVSVGNDESVYISSEQAKSGYLLTGMDVGKYPIKVTAYDYAGNHYTNSFPLFVTDHHELSEEGLIFGAFTNEEMSIIALIAVTLLALWFALYTYQQNVRRSRTLRVEVQEVQEQMEKIFTALRNEIHEQVQSIRSKSRLSKNEQSVVENLERALEVSNTLLEKEVIDVEKLLK